MTRTTLASLAILILGLGAGATRAAPTARPARCESWST